jgi:hypothetical protein
VTNHWTGNGTGNGSGNKTSLNQSVADLTVKSFSGGEVDANGDTSGDRISKTVDVSTAKGAVKRGVETANPIITTSKDRTFYQMHTLQIF